MEDSFASGPLFFLFPYFLSNQTQCNLTQKKKGVITTVILYKKKKTETIMKKQKRERPVREKDQRNSSVFGSVAN